MVKSSQNYFRHYFDLIWKVSLQKLWKVRYQASNSRLQCDSFFPLNFCCQSCYQFCCNVIYYCISFLGKNIIYSQEKYFPMERLSLGTFKDIWECFNPSHKIMSICLYLCVPKEPFLKVFHLSLLPTSIFPFPKNSN